MWIKALEKNQELNSVVQEINQVEILSNNNNNNNNTEEKDNYKENELNKEEINEEEDDSWLFERVKQELIKSGNTYIYIKNISKYYWVEWKRFFNKSEVCENLNRNSKYVTQLRSANIIETYNDISYFDWDKEWVYNLFNKNTLLKPSQTAKLDESIEYLINNLCWYNKENADYLHKSILYKYTHLNDVRIPAVVFYWAWWSWKWTFLKLLSKIFWWDNVLSNLWKQDLTSQFSPFRWDKLIVSFDEIVTNNTSDDTNITNKLKNLIFADKIVVNQKYVNTYPFDNIARFFISSNNNLPIKLDDKSVWNRRFNVFYTSESLKNTDLVYDAINDEKIVSNYIAWLFENYKEVLYWTKIESLENEDKKELEFTSQNESNIFWDWVEENHPDVYWKVWKSKIDKLIVTYLNSNEEIDKKDFMRYFWRNSRYMKKRFRIDWKLTYGALISKNEQLLKEKEDEINLKREKDEEILRKIWLQDSNIHWVNENWKVVEYSVDEWEKELEISFDFSNDL